MLGREKKLAKNFGCKKKVDKKLAGKILVT